MTSESSSAMLDLNDADTEDTEAPSVTDDAREAVPLMMEPGYDIAVKVDAPMKQLSTLETFVTYRVRCVCARWPAPQAVRRRYNHFKLLHRRLCAAHAWLAPPALPPLHSARQQLDRYSAAFVAVRTMALHAFLDRVAKHPIFTHSEDFRLFLTTPDEEFDKVFKSENSAMNLWGLSSALYGTNENKPTNGARVKDPEWTSYAEYLNSLQQKLTTLCSLTTKLHKGTAALSAEMINMKRTCDAWSSQARGDTARAAAAIARAAAPRAPLPPGLPPGPPGLAPRAPAMRHRALLPLLAAYTAAHHDKIRQRDALHAAYVAGATTGDMHNKLEQASEALRSELSDWLPKTRSEIKTLLIELADRQVNLHTQNFMSWEHALKLSNEANVEELFKTVSKTAVQNLSPSRCRSEMTPTETERDLDDLENYSISDSEERFENGDSKNSSKDWVDVKESAHGHETSAHGAETLVDDKKDTGLDPLNVQNVTGLDPLNIQSATSLEPQNTFDLENDGDSKNSNKDWVQVKESSILGAETLNEDKKDTGLHPLNVQNVTGLDPLNVQNGTELDPLNIQSTTSLDPLNVQNVTGLDPLNIQSATSLVPLNIQADTNTQEKEDFLSEILNDSVNNDSMSLKQSLKSDVVSDPLREFSEVDLRDFD